MLLYEKSEHQYNTTSLFFLFYGSKKCQRNKEERNQFLLTNFKRAKINARVFKEIQR